MDRPLHILIAGAGAVGCYYGARWQHAGHRVTFLARGDNLQTLQSHGLHLDSIAGNLTLPSIDAVATPPAHPVDVVVVTVKAYATDTIIAQIRPAVGPATVILSLQNGIGNEERLAAACGDAHIAGGIAFIGAERVGAGHIRHTAAGWLTIGPWTRSAAAPVAALQQALNRGGVECRYSEHIRRDLWQKLMWNAAFNTTTCLTGTPAHALLAHTAGEALVVDAMREVQRVAAAEGITLSDQALDDFLATTRNMGPVRTSMLVDREAGRRLEREAISGELLRRARAHGIEIPVQQVLYALLATLEYDTTTSTSDTKNHRLKGG